MSVQKRPDGRYRARLRGPDGKEVARHFDRERDAKAWEAEERTKMLRGDWFDRSVRRVTFREFATAWAAAQPWRPSTARRVSSALNVHLLPAFGDRPLASVRPSEVQALVKSISTNRSAGTARNVLAVLGAVYRAAVADHLVTENPVTAVKRPRYAPEVEIPSRADVDALLEAAGARWGALVVVAAGAGLRAGEALGLTVDRVRWLPREIVVDRQLVDGQYLATPGNRPGFAEPKGARSVRVVPAAGFVVDALARHVEQVGEGPDGLIFADALGRPMGRRDFTRLWARIQAAAGLKVGYHHLRHFCASTMLSNGVPVPLVAEVLGHTPGVLLATYSHVLRDDRDRARQAIEDAFADSTRTEHAV